MTKLKDTKAEKPNEVIDGVLFVYYPDGSSTYYFL